MSFPSAIIFINSDIGEIAKNTLKSQLFVDEVIDKSEFDLRLTNDPNYADIVNLQKQIVMVTLSNFSDLTNRQYADVVIFVKQGLVNVEKNKYGPPILALPVRKLNIFELLRGAGSNHVVILPENPSQPPAESCGCGSNLKGIEALEARDTSSVHCVNSDNERNNTDFKNRK